MEVISYWHVKLVLREVCPLSECRSSIVFFLVESADRAKAVFEEILKSKVRADATRNALTVLQRYRFLFSLPKNIEKNIKNVRNFFIERI